MNKKFFIIIALFAPLIIQGQVTCVATGDSGSGYSAFETAGFGVENPDCVHGDFGAHITQFFDETLEKNVFLFHSHIESDNDRCITFDRVRMEVKGGPNTDEELIHPIGSTAYYRWKFRIDENYIGGSTFHHIFQLKAKNGDDGIPVLTITLRTQTLEVRHDGGDSGVDLGVLKNEDLSLFKGKWVEAFIKVINSEEGAFEIELKDVLTGKILLAYSNDKIDLWRSDASYNRPKWGMYRAKKEGLVDEVFRFADFCISETSESLCPADAPLLVDNTPPTPPTNLQANQVMISSMNIAWEAAMDEFGVVAYQLYQDGKIVWEGVETTITLDNLSGSTTYNFSVTATDEVGNVSEQSNEISVNTDDVDALPSPATNPFPANQSTISPNNLVLTWASGENVDTIKIYLGTSATPEGFEIVTSNSFIPVLLENTSYYWQIIHSNSNGETKSPIWTFTTSTLATDAPWLVFRGNDRIDLETDFLKGLDIPETPTLDQVTEDPNGSGNQFYNYRHTEEEKFRWRQDFNTTDTAITVVTRIKALSADLNNIAFFEIKAFGWREKLRMNQKTIKLERSSPVIENDIPFAFKDAFHIIRVTMQGNGMTVYLDENPVPFAVGNSIDDDGSSRFEFGKAGSADIGATIDWMAVLNNGNYAPGEGPALPSDLFLSSDATLADLQINGVSIPDFSPVILDYSVDLGNVAEIPAINFTTNSDLAKVEITNPTTVPNSMVTLVVMAQDGFTQNRYTINYTGTVSTEAQLKDAGIVIFPNPVEKVLYINSNKNKIQSIQLFNRLGQSVYESQQREISKVKTTAFPSGLYFILLKDEQGQYFKKKILIN